ncbi:hypothetical protein HVW09_26320 (plasmid) [Escherichia coli]|nr:hypothetical protein HVW09_26250 [Escherichia coli]QLM65119.1 hypothetical protein HVW09_26320 [Escherichia coli]
MKKTLIALAVAASAAVSGSAMAWEHGGAPSQTVKIGGTFKVGTVSVSPWEVSVGNGRLDFQTPVNPGTKNFDVVLEHAVPVLGIRNTSTAHFMGQAGINPQVTLSGVDAKNATKSVATFWGQVRGADGAVIGNVHGPVFIGGEVSWSGSNGDYVKALSADTAGQAFFGGLPANSGQVASDVHSRMTAMNPEYVNKFTAFSDNRQSASPETFSKADYKYRAYYGAGFEKGATLKVTLNTILDKDTAWSISVPVTVSYM